MHARQPAGPRDGATALVAAVVLAFATSACSEDSPGIGAEMTGAGPGGASAGSGAGGGAGATGGSGQGGVDPGGPRAFPGAQGFGTETHRGPPAEGAHLDYRNNVVYDCAFEKLMDIVGPDSSFLELNLVGNYGKAGPNTPTTDAVVFTGLGGGVHLFADDNVYEPDRPLLSIYSDPVQANAAFGFPPVDTDPAAVALERVLDLAGAFPRDPMLLRTVDDVKLGTGSLGDVGDALLDTGPEPPADADEDGMADEWESARGLDPTDPTDGAGDADGNGYTDIEDYVNELAEAMIH